MMPEVGDIETKFGRHYTFTNPDPLLGPGTWRLSMPDEYPSSGGSGGGAAYDHDGIPPIVIDSKADPAGSGMIIVETSMDITKLDDRGA